MPGLVVLMKQYFDIVVMYFMEVLIIAVCIKLKLYEGILILGVSNIYLYWKIYHVKYKKTSKIANNFFKNKKLLVIVPHPDDELNVAGVMLQNAVNSNADIYIVYTSNFDPYGKKSANRRVVEQRNLCNTLGIKSENIFFLGFESYFDGIQVGEHIYNGDIKTKKTYALNGVKTYSTIKNGHESEMSLETFECLLEDVIINILPDIICCVDYDSHVDHRFASLMFEKVIDKLQICHSEYSPLILKGFSYATEWKGIKDFYSELRVGKSRYFDNHSSIMLKTEWDNRIRIPYINANNLGYTLRSCNLWNLYKHFSSQNALSHLNQVINSDQVFWKVSVDNVFIKSYITVSSGEVSNIFSVVRKDTANIFLDNVDFYPGGWKPSDDDSTPCINIRLKERKEINRLIFVIWIQKYISELIIEVVTDNDKFILKEKSVKRGWKIIGRDLERKIDVEEISFVFKLSGKDVVISRIIGESDLFDFSSVKVVEKSTNNYLYEVRLRKGEKIDVGIEKWTGGNCKYGNYKLLKVNNNISEELKLNLGGYYTVEMENKDFELWCCYGTTVVDIVQFVNETYFDRLIRYHLRRYSQFIEEITIRVWSKRYQYKNMKLKRSIENGKALKNKII